MRKALLLILVGCTQPAASTPDASRPPPPAVGTVELFATLPASTEGLAFGRDADGQPVLFAGGSHRIFKIHPKGAVSEHAQVPNPLGMALLPDGDVVVCGKAGGDAGPLPGVLWRVTPSGNASILLDGDFVLTNAIAVAPDGSLLFTDSADDKAYRVNVDGTGLALVTGAISYPNGVAFSADGQRAFIASWNGRRVYSLGFQAGAYGAPEVWIDPIATPDGLAVLESGDVVVMSTGDGIVRAAFDTAATTTIAAVDNFAVAANGAFGAESFGREWLYVTDLLRAELVRVYVGERGLLLPRVP